MKVDVGLHFIKSPNANWMISGWQTLERAEVAVNGFRKAGILDAINLWSSLGDFLLQCVHGYYFIITLLLND